MDLMLIPERRFFMSLFQKENAYEENVNYKSMGKDQLIMLITAQKSDIEVLTRKLAEAGSAVDEKNRLAQQVQALSAENEALKAKNAELEQKAAATENEITEIGSIAEMSFRVNGVMDAAQKAADDYVAKIREMYEAMSQDYSTYEINAQKKADAILSDANAKAQTITQNARNEANGIWNALQSRFDNYVDGKKQPE